MFVTTLGGFSYRLQVTGHVTNEGDWLYWLWTVIKHSVTGLRHVNFTIDIYITMNLSVQ